MKKTSRRLQTERDKNGICNVKPTRRFSKIIWCSAQCDIAHPATVHQQGGHIFEVGASKRTSDARIQPFHNVGLAKTRYPNINARWIAGLSRDRIIDQPDVIDPTIDHQRDQQFRIQPYVKIIGILLAIVVDAIRFA